ITLMGRWHDGQRFPGVAISETDDAPAMASWILHWNSIRDAAVTPVVDDEEARAIGKKRFGYGAHSARYNPSKRRSTSGTSSGTLGARLGPCLDPGRGKINTHPCHRRDRAADLHWRDRRSQARRSTHH